MLVCVCLGVICVVIGSSLMFLVFLFMFLIRKNLFISVLSQHETLSPKQMIDVLVATSTPFGMVDGDVVWPSTNFPSCTLACSYQSVSVKRHRHPNTCVGTVDMVSIGTSGGFWDLSIF